MRLKHIAPLLLVVLGFSACSEASQDFHFTYFTPTGNKVFYADQQTDTVHLVSTDPWTASSSASWFTFTPNSGKPSGSQVSSDTRLNFTFDANTTGSIRFAVINVNSENSIALPVYQLPWLRVSRPEPTYLNDNNVQVNALEASQMICRLNVLAASQSDSVKVYNYQPGARLTVTGNGWIAALDTTFSSTGMHVVKLSYQPNTTAQEREAKLTFTSAGVSQEIVLVQGKKSEEK